MKTPDPNYFKEHPYSGTQYFLKSNFPEFYEYLQQTYPDLRLSEQMYRYFYGEPNKCPVCGKPTSYINFNKGYNTCCSIKCSRKYAPTIQKMKQTCLEKYGVENPQQCQEIKDKTKQTNLERYGVEHVLQSPEFLEKSKQTCLDRYGVEYCGQIKEGQEKSHKTCMERYGVEYAFQADETKEKIRKTCMERYGVPSPMESPEIREKSKRTCKKRYGTENVMQNDVIKQKVFDKLNECYGGIGLASQIVRDKASKTCMERYNAPNPMACKDIQKKSLKTYKHNFINKKDFLIGYTEDGDWICKCPHPDCDKCTEKYFIINPNRHGGRIKEGAEICTRLFPIGAHETSISNISQKVFKYLDEVFEQYTTHYASKDYECRVGKYSLDYLVEELNLVIEFNGDYWHANPKKYNEDWFHPIMNKTAKEIWEKDKTRTEYLESLGYKVIVIWESDLNTL